MNYKLGDEIELFNSTLKKNITFIIIGVDHKLPDTITLFSKDIINFIPFDEESNDYQKSSIFKYLNEDILNGFGSHIIRNIRSVKNPTIIVDSSKYENKLTHVEDIECKLTLLSKTEVGLNGELNLFEGEVYPYFKDRNYITNRSWWLRTPNPDTNDYQGYITKYGTYESIDVNNNKIGLRFTFTMNKELEVL